MKILVIDDEKNVRSTICENLELCGYEVMQATDGENGLEIIDAEDPPQLVITDIIMPRKEGLETIMQLRKIYPAMKVIAISGGGRTRTMDFLALAEKLGANAVLPKPIDLDELERTVKSLSGASS
ncbi:MAG: response regulator [Alphaproteobacteria bacterium]|nr:response regulator [Alphaproteobacteria bacterium]MBU0859540.1 response regulator [Alphaproteobacteria bacterium]